MPMCPSCARDHLITLIFALHIWLDPVTHGSTTALARLPSSQTTLHLCKSRFAHNLFPFLHLQEQTRMKECQTRYRQGAHTIKSQCFASTVDNPTTYSESQMINPSSFRIIGFPHPFAISATR